ncbi:glycine betaine ABC transporter substrate-binding protein [Clostridium lundense]|uniref:ABC transporter permease/substrate-binding protein n=1 Tax=Clostridium lundense TaxID=319475 RepID=UPI0005575A01|nr:glycine betaine ABC transporter substrate-binding protein [Clostridium lundense]
MSLNKFFDFILTKKAQLLSLALKHIQLSALAVVIAILIGIPLGILISKKKKLAPPVIGLANILQAIPSLALMGFLIPFWGIGETPAIIMVCLYSLLPIIKNTYTGLSNINPATIEAGKAMGMTETQLLSMVELPLALPIIMAGIRISAVTSVGLMTIAAFIGAGGLGSLIFTGIQTVNPEMILAGAIPACILALLMDFIIGKVEKIVDPKNKNNKGSKKIIGITTIVLIIALIVPMFSGIFKTKNTITIGSKSFTESRLLGNIYAILIEENTDLNVERKFDMAGTDVLFKATDMGEIDMYPEYTGTVLVNILKQDAVSDPDKTYEIAKKNLKEKYNIELLKPLGFNNTYTLALKKDTAEKYNLNSFSDLAKVSKSLTLGPTMEFIGRPDGLVGLQKKYNMQFKEVTGLDAGLRYSAITSNQIDVTDAFSTDGLLEAFKLKVLKDDKGFFPPYYAAPIIRSEVLKNNPKLEELLNKLAGSITDEKMRNLNYQCDKLGKDPETVAREFLKSQNLIK